MNTQNNHQEGQPRADLHQELIKQINAVFEENEELHHENQRLAHVAMELADGLEVIVNKVQPNINRLSMNLRRPIDKANFKFTLTALKEVQSRAWVLVQGLGQTSQGLDFIQKEEGKEDDE